MKNYLYGLLLGLTVTTVPLIAVSQSDGKTLDDYLAEVTKDTKPEEVPAEPTDSSVVCAGCTDTEQEVAEFFFEEGGVTDPTALAVVMGAVKQESRFNPSVCEGGAITSYRGCRRGGFGLIQFTSRHRYNGLGRYARQNGLRPESLNAQLGYILTEREWLKAANIFRQTGLSINSYFHAGKIWLGYGIGGNRYAYARDFQKRLVVS